MKLTVPHWIIAALVLLGTIAPPLGAQFPDLLPYAKLISQLDPILLGALGYATASVVTSTNVMAAIKSGAVRVAGAALWSIGLAVILLCSGCSAAQTKADVAQGIDLTNAVCSLAPDSPVGQPYVEIICAVAQGAEQVVSVVVGAVDGTDAGTAATMSVPVVSVRIRIPAPQAAAYLKAHASYTVRVPYDGGAAAVH